MKKLWIVFSFLFVTCMMVSCSKEKSFEEKLVGTWVKYVEQYGTEELAVYTLKMSEDKIHTAKQSNIFIVVDFYPNIKGKHVVNEEEKTVHFYQRKQKEPGSDEYVITLDRPWYYWRVNYLTDDEISVDMYDQFDVLYKSDFVFYKD